MKRHLVMDVMYETNDGPKIQIEIEAHGNHCLNSSTTDIVRLKNSGTWDGRSADETRDLWCSVSGYPPFYQIAFYLCFNVQKP